MILWWFMNYDDSNYCTWFCFALLYFAVAEVISEILPIGGNTNCCMVLNVTDNCLLYSCEKHPNRWFFDVLWMVWLIFKFEYCRIDPAFLSMSSIVVAKWLCKAGKLLCRTSGDTLSFQRASWTTRPYISSDQMNIHEWFRWIMRLLWYLYLYSYLEMFSSLFCIAICKKTWVDTPQIHLSVSLISFNCTYS